jgi:hypothetical protein
MSNVTVLTEDSLGLVAGGKNRCDRPPSTNHAELYAWSSYCAFTQGGSQRMWYMQGYDMLTTEQPQQPKKQPKK